VVRENIYQIGMALVVLGASGVFAYRQWNRLRAFLVTRDLVAAVLEECRDIAVDPQQSFGLRRRVARLGVAVMNEQVLWTLSNDLRAVGAIASDPSFKKRPQQSDISADEQRKVRAICERIAFISMFYHPKVGRYIKRQYLSQIHGVVPPKPTSEKAAKLKPLKKDVRAVIERELLAC